MRVTVYQLRHQGVKLPKDQPDGPHLGWLRMRSYNIDGVMTPMADLHASASRGAPPMLDGLTQVVVQSIDERGLMLQGVQVNPYGGERYRQAWWCVLVTDRL